MLKVATMIAAAMIIGVGATAAEARQHRHQGGHGGVLASWYGGGEKLSSRTANGEHFRPGGLTAAHRSLPFGTRIQVTNVRTGQSAVVRINDRGPAAKTGRSLDLARGAARAIGLHGVGHVAMTVL
jgi:rare lipoprotein A